MNHDLYSFFFDSKQKIVRWDEVEKVNVISLTQIDLLALYLAEDERKGREKLRYIMKSGRLTRDLELHDEQLSRLGLKIPRIELLKIPQGSHVIQIAFRLKKPYISLDDESFYIVDNPLVKDTVFKIPMIRPSTWKGALRWVVRSALGRSRAIVERLFGNEKEAEHAKQGRLIFYATFLDRVSLDVITPLRRETRTPRRGPILFEIAPAGSRGMFSLLYIPFDLLHILRSGDSMAKARAMDEIKEDIETLKEAIPAMFTTYGFAAKKTSGYGVAEDEIDFRLDSMEMKAKNFDEFKKQMESLVMNLGGTRE
ncbi:MAG: RAMP superfamily CRISPR-associated protein [Nitrososphaerota archaeon]|nr:hypothetical protein [Candidatus Brockarchaeota archaeon]